MIVGNKRADYKLFDVINSKEAIPHVMKYDLRRKAWESYDEEELIINILDDVEFVYQYHKLIKSDINYLLSFLNLYSSAKLERLNLA